MFKSFKKKKNTASLDGPLDVALIGCGPAGMMFLHAVTEKKKTEDPKHPVPNVTCYESAGSPGGVWKDVPQDDPERKREENKVLMYDDLWTNIPKELMEYYDYTFDEHFKKPTPTFLPRKDVLEYIIARNSLDGALDNVKFNHEVVKVIFNEADTKFTVTAMNTLTKSETTAVYDRVVFAGGVQAAPEVPPEIVEVTKEFKGKVIHSSEALDNFENDVKGKTIMMVGDSSSAEDLTLRAIKYGANKVVIAARRGLGDCAETGCWPANKAEVVYSLPYKVVKDGTVIKCQPMYWSEKRQKWRRDDEEEVIKVKDVEVIILCTGYDYDFDCIEEAYQADLEQKWEISKGWKMDNNALTITLGSPTPNKTLWTGNTLYTGIYNGALIKNPNIFYLLEAPDTYSPLLDLDVLSWVILSYLTGENPILPEKDMVKNNQKQLEQEMQIPYLRVGIDYEYFAEIDELDEKHWSENAADERSIKLERQDKDFKARCLARDMKLCKYPVQFGEFKKLSPMGEKYVDICVGTERARSYLNKDSPESEWKTFRDVDTQVFVSLYTSTPSCPLPNHWLDITKDADAPAKLENYK